MGKRPKKNEIKYLWEFYRRNPEYRADWSGYWHECDFERFKKLILKWGPFTFPQSRFFNKSYDEIPRAKRTWIPESWGKKHQKYMMEVWVNNIKEIFKGVLVTEYSHFIGFDTDDDGEGYFAIMDRERGDKVKLDNNIIPDEVTVKISNLKAFLGCSNKMKAHIIELIIDELTNQLRAWAYYANQADLSSSDTRHHWQLYDKYLIAWDMFQDGKTGKEVAEKLWPQEYAEENINLAKPQPATEQEWNDYLNDSSMKQDERIKLLIEQGMSDNEAKKVVEHEHQEEGNQESCLKQKKTILRSYNYRDAAQKIIDDPKRYFWI
ncbi:MAG: hypothetical protein ABIM40_09785 [Pseudomonadota bacterium]